MVTARSGGNDLITLPAFTGVEVVSAVGEGGVSELSVDAVACEVIINGIMV